MTKLLASVSNTDEAMIALAAGADIIDLKDPSTGALGALPLSVLHEITSAVNGIRPISATIGDLPMQPELLASKVQLTAATGVDFIKIGFFDNGDHVACLTQLRPLIAKGLKLIAVLFADRNPDFSIMPKLQEAGFYGVMLDTSLKNGHSLLDHISPANLRYFTNTAKACDLYCGLAGSVTVAQVNQLLGANPDYLGFRGALCVDSNRKSMICESKVKQLQNMLQKNNTASTDWLGKAAAPGNALHA